MRPVDRVVTWLNRPGLSPTLTIPLSPVCPLHRPVRLRASLRLGLLILLIMAPCREMENLPALGPTAIMTPLPLLKLPPIVIMTVVRTCLSRHLILTFPLPVKSPSVLKNLMTLPPATTYIS